MIRAQEAAHCGGQKKRAKLEKLDDAIRAATSALHLSLRSYREHENYESLIDNLERSLDDHERCIKRTRRAQETMGRALNLADERGPGAP